MGKTGSGQADCKKVIANLEKLREEIRTAKPELWALADRKLRLIGYVNEAVELLKEKNDE